ncbi:MAG: HlyD family efflux transporter periplasmic adaptor subunit [Chlorobi bacterium]|nr:HlyD family efflux transporter periplasmic adaptor subunit [Chlorobiota bacterium]
MLKTRKRLLIFLLAVIGLLALFILGRDEIIGEDTVNVKRGDFELVINTKGEVQGKNAILINLPKELSNRRLRIYSLQLKDMVQEGTMVKKGDWIATLDPGALKQQMQRNLEQLEKKDAELKDAKIDSTIQLTKFREEIGEIEFDLKYKKLELEQSVYESPAFQRKAQMAYNQAIRQLNKKKRDYELKQIELSTKIRRIKSKHDWNSRLDSLFKAAARKTRVTAPRDGMVMYARLWGGRKLKVGDKVGIWNPKIATLPDLSVLVSETYVQEIDVTKLDIGDSVNITIDALPGKKYSGVISKIANIGQEMAGFDTKVFKVIIDFNEKDKKLKPAMTTDNYIIADKLANVLIVPRSSIYSDNGDNFVFIKQSGKIYKKRVKCGLENEETTVIEAGLKENDKILDYKPENADKLEFLDSL